MKLYKLTTEVNGTLFYVDGKDVVFYQLMRKLTVRGEDVYLRNQEVDLIKMVLDCGGKMKTTSVAYNLGTDLNTISVLKRNINKRLGFELFVKSERDFVRIKGNWEEK